VQRIEARNHLNRTYDFFVSRFGPLNARENVKAFAGDPDHPLLLSLEEVQPGDQACKTPIYARRTLERYRPVDRVEAASEALLVSLNETGGINWPRMESLTSRCAADLQDELGSLAYRNPGGVNGKPPTDISVAMSAPNSSWRSPPGNSTPVINEMLRRCAKFSLRTLSRARSKRAWAHHGFRLLTSGTSLRNCWMSRPQA
jgi:hypothetical protein